MSTHDRIAALLDDFAGGKLPEGERRAVQRHLAECAACRAEVESLRALLDEARFLPREVAPSRDLWAEIAPRLQPREAEKVISLEQRRRRIEVPRWLLAAAAVVLVVSSSLVTMLAMRSREATPVLPGMAAEAPSSPVTTALVAFQPAEAEYNRVIDELSAILETKRDQLAPETVATLETNLRIIDEAIRQSREALENDPNSPELAQMLSGVYRTKVETLQRAVQL